MRQRSARRLARRHWSQRRGTPGPKGTWEPHRGGGGSERGAGTSGARNVRLAKGEKHRPLGRPGAVLTVHADPALLLAHRLQEDPVQHATRHGPADGDGRVQVLRRQRRVGLQSREHLRPGQRLRSSGRRGELHGARGGRAGGRAQGSAPCLRGGEERAAGQGPGAAGGRGSPPSPPPPARGSGAAAHLQPARGAPTGRRVQRGPGRGGVGPGSGAGPSREETRKEPGGAARPPAPSEPPPFKPRPASPAAGAGLGLGMERGRQGWAGGVAARGRPLRPAPAASGAPSVRSLSLRGADGPGFSPSCPQPPPLERAGPPP